jgi:hypothetical protein
MQDTFCFVIKITTEELLRERVRQRKVGQFIKGLTAAATKGKYVPELI